MKSFCLLQPFWSYHTNKNIDTGEDGSHGNVVQLAFKAHMKELDSTEDPDMRREIVRTRLGRHCFFVLPIRTTTRYGCCDCLDLLTKRGVMDSMNFPPYLPHAS